MGRHGAHAQGHGLALVLRQMQHAQTRLMQRQGIEHLGGVVAGAVVDRNHFQVAITLGQRRANGLGGVVAFVVARDQDRDQRLALEQRRRGVIGPWPVALPVQPEVQATGDPQPGHEQRVEKHELHQELPSDQKDKAQGHTQHQCQNEKS